MATAITKATTVDISCNSIYDLYQQCTLNISACLVHNRKSFPVEVVFLKEFEIIGNGKSCLVDIWEVTSYRKCKLTKGRWASDYPCFVGIQNSLELPLHLMMSTKLLQKMKYLGICIYWVFKTSVTKQALISNALKHVVG